MVDPFARLSAGQSRQSDAVTATPVQETRRGDQCSSAPGQEVIRPAGPSSEFALTGGGGGYTTCLGKKEGRNRPRVQRPTRRTRRMGAGTKAAAVQPRPKKLYREKDERPAVGIKASAKHAASAKQAEAVSRNALQKTAASAGLTALGRAVPLAQLTRKELQARAIKAGLKANAKSSDLVKALEAFAASAAAGAALLQQPVKGLKFEVDAERAEVRARRPDARVAPAVAPAWATVRLAWLTLACAPARSARRAGRARHPRQNSWRHKVEQKGAHVQPPLDRRGTHTHRSRPRGPRKLQDLSCGRSSIGIPTREKRQTNQPTSSRQAARTGHGRARSKQAGSQKLQLSSVPDARWTVLSSTFRPSFL